VTSFCEAGKEAARSIYGGWVNMTVPFFGACGPQFMKFWENVSFAVFNAIPGYHVSMILSGYIRH